MRYSIDVLDNSKTKVAELTGMVTSHLLEKVNGMALLIVETIDKSEWSYINPGTSFLRLETSDSGSYSTLRVMEVKKVRVKERSSIRVTARHILYDTSKEIFAKAVNCVNYTPEELAMLVLGFSSYDAGTIGPTVIVPFVRFEYEPVINCLLRICSITGAQME